jgi:hypothetical protein
MAAILSHFESVPTKPNLLVHILERHEQHINALANNLVSLTSQ